MKNTNDMNNRMSAYYDALNKLQATTTRYQSQMTSNVASLEKQWRDDTYNIQKTVNTSTRYLDNKITTQGADTNQAMQNLSDSTNTRITQGMAIMQSNIDLYRSNINKYMDIYGNANLYVDQELRLFKEKGVFNDILLQGYKPTCRINTTMSNSKEFACKDNEYMSGTINVQVGSNVQIQTKCCKVPGL
jgi:hypothetical protein